jgi:hypothetical protein
MSSCPWLRCRKKFAATTETFSRLGLIDDATARLEKLGAHKTASRFLYSATNPIGEECFRECNFLINEDFINEVAIEAGRWIDFWRDNYAFVASRVADGLRRLLQMAPLQKRRPAFTGLPPALRRAKAAADRSRDGDLRTSCLSRGEGRLSRGLGQSRRGPRIRAQYGRLPPREAEIRLS